MSAHQLAAAWTDPQFQFFLAKLFGQRMVGTSTDGVGVVAYKWRNRTYIDQIIPIPARK